MGRSAIVLAAGLGTRMKSKRHKVLHEVCGKPMILHILDELEQLDLDQIIVVVGQQREAVQAAIGGRAEIAVQSEQLGTGHAVQAAVPLLRQDVETTIVLYGDAPLIRAQTISALLSEREQSQAAACVLTADVANPKGLGRVILDDSGHVTRVVEEKDATADEKHIHLINTGIYAFDTIHLVRALARLQPDNAQGEYYLTDTLSILREECQHVCALPVEDVDEIASVNDLVQLADVERLMRVRICQRWMREGVTIVNPEHTYIGLDVTIGRDTILYPGTILEGKTVIGDECIIGPNTRLVNMTVSDRVKVEQSVGYDSLIEGFAQVGPFAYIRPGSEIGARVKIGDFVEIKKSKIGEDTKISHLAYVGDATVGKRVNIGCGVITVNYDGKEKHQTLIGDDSFVGSNVNLIAPLSIGEGAYLCAGSTITDEVPTDGFAIGRNRQVTKADYVKSWRKSRLDKDSGDEEA
ncbi:bifunctional UDP-N-acetylglucosamine diphosphorylase/glucosamine-1-phosphate N-acetyltransferase GlmU [Alicyclobacillus ferrooxydans]|uniref:Bifunctional protein GlmU n=1 Tax=Alicyclobacillus ferrooxydans TaxID=471514 RepID=A0A0P9D5C4_9BACL|nr:bifunctional UDP-N-acetylglucosamine diphosphorylase/glucosamine-1-phosphate N-acetyltransferase GlmU [Alicyclobacillus ferrooxydans]KPV44647.1 bifunctional N-acetylglucosamine-1-phosphate uridyltransferase/glucosamine-1-phosphate acetyltransferase [Alicyclobacillus ferrooxydans]